MIWNDHSREIRRGDHAVFSPSQYAWLNYSPEKLLEVYKNKQAAKKGTEDHDFAAMCIKRRQRLWRSKRTLESYVNDAVGFGMDPEVLLYFSPYFYGWCDAILYDETTKVLRIHDLKTGVNQASMCQLEIYAALFFLEYGERYKITPLTVTIELRIYQNDDIHISLAPGERIKEIMDLIVFDNGILMKEDGGMHGLLSGK